MEFTAMVKMTQKTLKKRVALELEAMGFAVQVSDGFVYAPGDVPVLLVAHLDTVHARCAKSLRYSEDGTLVSSPEGIGGDDRCGVHIILQVLRKHRCHVLFSEDEETGCRGAHAFTAAQIQPAVHYMAALDRSGDSDAVFYACDNPDFTKFVCSFGFHETEGTHSDISVLAPHLGIAGVNLSAGYYRQHRLDEYVSLAQMEEITGRVCQMVQTETGRFAYIRRPPSAFSWNSRQGSLLARILRMEEEEEQDATREEDDPCR